MSNVYARVVDLDGSGTGGGGGALIVAERSDNSNPAIFADFAALEVYTGTATGTADAARINVENAANAREVFAVGTVNGDNQVMTISAAYIRLSDAWVAVTTNLVGSPGTNGEDGVDGNNFEFVDRASRDVFFAARPDLLVHNLPIIVAVDDTTIMNEIWTGPTAPASYTPATDAIFFVAGSVMAATSSFFLGGIHVMSSGGENVFFTNNDSDVSYAPPWQFVGNHTTPEGRMVSARPTARDYGDLTFDEPRGTNAATGAVEYNVDFTLPVNESVFGVKVVAAENYTGMLEYRVTRMNTVIVAYDNFQTVTVAPGDDLELWFPFPVEGRQGIDVQVDLFKPDGTRLLVRPLAVDPAIAYTEIRFRQFTDRSLAYQIDNFNYAARAVELTAATTITSANRDTYDNLFLYAPTSLSGTAATLNIAADADLNGFDIVNLNTGTLTITGQGGVLIDGQTSFVLANQFDSGRLIAEPDIADRYIFLFESFVPSVTEDNYVDTLTTGIAGQDLTITLGRTGALADLSQTVTLPEGEMNVQSDWDETDTSSDAFIQNKPTIPVLRTASETADLLETLTNDERLDASAIRNLPADIDNYVDTLDLSVSGQDLTITLGRTGTLADLTQTVTLPDGNTMRTDEEIRDVVAAMLTAGTNVTLTEDDAADTLTIASTDTNTMRTDEDIRDVIGAALVAGEAITITVDDAGNTITIASTGGTPTPTPGPTTLYYGLSSANDPATVDVSTLTLINSTDPQTVSTGVATQGNYFIILTANTHDISSITDTVLQQDVTDIFTKTNDVRTISTVVYDSYVIGPLNAGVDEDYVLRF